MADLLSSLSCDPEGPREAVVSEGSGTELCSKHHDAFLIEKQLEQIKFAFAISGLD